MCVTASPNASARALTRRHRARWHPLRSHQASSLSHTSCSQVRPRKQGSFEGTLPGRSSAGPRRSPVATITCMAWETSKPGVPDYKTRRSLDSGHRCSR